MTKEKDTSQKTGQKASICQAEEPGKTVRLSKAGKYVYTPAEQTAAKKPSKPKPKTKKNSRRSTVDKSRKPNLLPDDPDHQWLKQALRSAQTVAQILSIEGQFQNKIRALKLHHAQGRPLHDYALRMEQFLLRLRTYPWQTPVRDIRQEDVVIKKLRL